MPALNPSQQQQQPRDAPYSQNPSQPLQQVGGGMYGQQTHPQQQPPNLYGGSGSINSNAYNQPPQPSSNLYGQRQQQLPSTSAFGQQSSNSYGGPSNSLAPPPGFAQLNNTGSGVPTTYNMGGAPPVNQQQSPYGPSFVTNPPGGTHQPLSYPQQPAGGVGGGWNSNQQQGAIDILGLADKAASAIQAMGSSNIGNMGFPNTTVQQQHHPQQQHYPPSAQQQHPSSSYTPYSSGMGGQQPPPPPSVQPNIMQQQQQHQSQPYFQQQQQQPFAAPQGDPNSQSGRRRTTAKLNELPLTVQYAVQVSLPFIEFVSRYTAKLLTITSLLSLIVLLS